MSVESAFFSKLLATKDFKTVNDKHLTTSFFVGTNRQVFKYLQEHQLEYGTTPAKETLLKRFPDVVLDDVADEPMAFYCDEVRRKVKHNELVDTINSVTKDINNSDADSGLQKLRKLIQHIDSDVEFSESCVIGENTEQRLQEYYDRQKSGGMTGILTGDSIIDKATGGLKKLDLMTMMAYTGVGNLFCRVA